MFDIKSRGEGVGAGLGVRVLVGVGVGVGGGRGIRGGGTHFVMVMGMFRVIDPFFKALGKIYILDPPFPRHCRNI